MRLELNENLPKSLVKVLTELGHDVDTVPGEGLCGATDPRVCRRNPEVRSADQEQLWSVYVGSRR